MQLKQWRTANSAELLIDIEKPGELSSSISEIKQAVLGVSSYLPNVIVDIRALATHTMLTFTFESVPDDTLLEAVEKFSDHYAADVDLYLSWEGNSWTTGEAQAEAW